MNLQRVIVEPGKRQALATRRAENRFVQIPRRSYLIDVEIIRNRTRSSSCGRLNQNRRQLPIRRELPTQLLTLDGTCTDHHSGGEYQKTYGRRYSHFL